MSKKTQKKASKAKPGKSAPGRSRTEVKGKAKASAQRTTTPKAKPKAKAKANATVARKTKPAATGSKQKSVATKSQTRTQTKATKLPARKAVAKDTAAAGSRPAARKSVKPVPGDQPLRDSPREQAGPGLTVGSKAPAFQLPRDGGATVSLDSFAGRRLVLFFYPRASTPGCTKEAMDFSRLSRVFSALDTDVVGVSADPQRAQETFRDKHDLTVPLLSDETHTVLQAFGVWGDKSLYGRTFQGIIRTTVLIGQDGRVLNIWRNVKVDGHADAVLKYVENL